MAWISFGIPLGAALAAWGGLVFDWTGEHHRPAELAANVLATAAPLWGLGALLYVKIAGPEKWPDYTLEWRGLLISVSGVVAGLIASRFSKWYSAVSLAASAWTSILFFLMCSTY